MQRYFTTKKVDNKFILNNDDLYHIKTVMRMKESDNVEVVYENTLYICGLNNQYEAEIKKQIENKDKNIKEIILIIPLLKEQKMDLILQKATELGVSKIIPVITERTIIKLDDEKQQKKLIRWQKIIKEASEQSKRLDIPTLSPIKTIDELSNLDGLKLICSTTEKENTLKNILKNNPNYDKITFIIGPEGGLSLKEEEKLVSYDFTKITLGHLIMRVETVPMFILSILNYENME